LGVKRGRCARVENHPTEEETMSNLRPAGHHTVTPAFVVPGSANVIGFLERAFGAKVVDRYEGPGGTVMHAEVLIGDSVIMCGEPTADFERAAAVFSLYVADGKAVDATYRRALEAGATAVNEPQDQPWGYRAGTVKDPGGNRWTICAVIEVVTHDEILRRMANAAKA
jgi:PhnB protein